MKKKLIAITIFLIVCIASTFIYAAIDAKIQINPSVSTVKPGEEVTFTVKVKDIVSENGANGLEGTISYDTDVFEPIQDGSVTKAGSWDVAYYNQKVIAEGLSAIKSDSDIINIKLKVKDDNSLVGRTSSLSLNNAVVYNTEKVELGSVSGSVKIIAKDEGGEEKPQETQRPQQPDGPIDRPEETQKPGNDATPTPSRRPGETNSTPKPEGNGGQNNGNNKEDIPITNIDTNTSTGSSSNKGNSTTVGSSSAGSSITSSSKTNTTNSTTALKSIPKAGINSTIIVLVGVLSVIGTVAYIKLRKYNEI